ncbi:MAG TPA: GNAT family N-acetyltransferase [bacterium]|nr:GNAT family N-acetyltransferase [bacterium]
MDLIEINPEQDPRWDQFVSHHQFGWITHLSSWKKVIEKSFRNVRGSYFALVENQNIIAGLPIFIVKRWLLGNELISIPFGTISDPLVSDDHHAKLLLDHASQFAKKQKIEHIQIRAFKAAQYLKNAGAPFEIDDSYKQHFLMLDKSLDELKLSFNRRNVTKRIRQSGNSDLSLRHATTMTDIEQFYELYLTTRKRFGLPPQPLQFIINLWERFTAQNQLDLILAELNDNIIGGLLFFKYKDRINAEIIAYEESYRDLHLSQFLYWHAIMIAKHENYQVFDFGRTSIFNEGLMNYKNRWGTQTHNLPIFHFSLTQNKRQSSRENLFVYNLARSISKKLPAPLFRAYGNFFYHHLA